MHIVWYLRQGLNVFETYWTTIRGVEAMDNSYRLLDLTVYGRQETWEDAPTGWPQRFEGKQNSVPTDVPRLSGPASKPDTRMTCAPASVEFGFLLLDGLDTINSGHLRPVP